MNKKIDCENCGSPMTEVYTKKGMKLYICPHNKAKIVNNRVGMPLYGVVYCNNETFGLKRAFEQLTAESTTTLKDLSAATENKIDDAILLKSANLALELDFDADILPDLFSAAMYLGFSLGLSPDKSIESLVKGIARRSPRVLDNIGVIFLQEQADQWYMQERKKKCDHELTWTQAIHDKAWREYAIHLVIEKAKKVKGEK